MGLIRAAIGTIGGTLADQWKDYLTIPIGIGPTAALFPAVPVGTNVGRGSNTKGSQAILTNGSRIVVPEGYGLLLFQDGALTAFVGEPGAYIWDSDDVNSQSIFAGDKWATSLVSQSWERFKFGGRPGSQQMALFVRLNELPNNKFGTQTIIYWDDAYLNAQVGALAHGTYSLTIVDPILFVKQFVPAVYLQEQDVFDFTDRTNPSASQLFSEVVGSLAAALSSYTNDPHRGNRIGKIQQDSIGFAKSLSQAVEETYDWQTTRGLVISKVTIVGIRYDEATAELLKTVQRADALSGARGNANLQASIAAGMQSAGQVEGASGIIGLGVAGGAIGLSSLQNVQSSEPSQAGNSDLLKTLETLKRAFDAGLITKGDFDAAKAKALGL
jgi:membrane protease subunit (stomatin/prohibitin family)